MEKNVAVKIKIDTETKSLGKLNDELIQTQENSQEVISGLKRIRNQLDGLAHPLQSAAIGFKFFKGVGELLASPIKESIHLNSVLEQQKLSLASLVTLNHQNIDSLGQSIDATTKWSMSMDKANEIIKDMTRIHQSAIYSVADLTEMFKSFYSTASASMSLSQAQKVFESIVYAAQTSGASVESLKSTLDSLGSGVAQTVTTFGRFVAAQGLSTEAMSKAKKEGTLYSLMLEKLGVFSDLASKSALTYEAALSSLHTGIDALKQAALAPYFQSITESIKEVGDYLNHHTEELAQYVQIAIEAGKHIAIFAGAIVLAKPAIASFNAVLAYSRSSIALFSSGINVANAATKAFTWSLRGLKLMLSSFVVPAVLFSIAEIFLNWKNDTSDTLKNLNKIDNDTLKKNLEKQKKLVEKYREDIRFTPQNETEASDWIWKRNQLPKEEARLKELEAEFAKRQAAFNASNNSNKPELVGNTKAITQDSNAISNLNKAYLELAQIGMSEYDKQSLNIALKTQDWIDSGVSLNDALQSQSVLIDELDSKYQKVALKNYFEVESQIQSKNIEAMDEGLSKNIALENLRTRTAINNLNSELKERLKNKNITIEQANELYKAEVKLHDKKIKDLKKQAIKTNAFYADFTNNLNSALNEQFFNALSGKFSDLASLGKDIGTSVSSALTQAFSRSLVQAMIDSSVGEAFSKTISGAFDKVFGEGELFEQYGEGFGKSAGDKIGGALAGAAAGIAASGVLSGLLGDNAQAKKDMQTGGMIGAGVGALAGAYWGPIGSMIGGMAGGISGSILAGFKTYEEKSSKQSIELFSSATKDIIKASERTDWHSVTKNGFGWVLNSKDWVEYQEANVQALRAVRDNLRTFGYLLEDISGTTKDLSVQAGVYKDFVDITNASAKDFIASFLGRGKGTEFERHYYEKYEDAVAARNYSIDQLEDDLYEALKDSDFWWEDHINDRLELYRRGGGFKQVYSPEVQNIYKHWSDYASVNSKDTASALKDVLSKYVSSGQGFQKWLFGFKGDDRATLLYQKQLSDKSIARLEESLGVKDINIDNYLTWREKAIKESFDPNTINLINDLGDALKNGAEASRKYEEALKSEHKTKLKMIDPYLKRTKMLSELNEDRASSSEKLGIETLKTLKNLLSSFQEVANALTSSKKKAAGGVI